MKCVLVAFACTCLVLPAGAQQVVKQILPTPPRGDQLEVRLSTATIQPGAIGNVTVEFRNGEPKVYKAGQGFVEPVNAVLRGRNKGGTPVKLVIFQVSPPEVPGAVDAP